MGAQSASMYSNVAKIGLAGLALVANFSFAQQGQGGAKAKGAPTAEDQKLDISDLENKYWAPKDTDFSVVQNRTYSKEHRFFLTPQWGKAINDQWSDGSIYGATANYFWSERWGVQATYIKASLGNNQAADVLATTYSSGVMPNHNRLNNYWGVGLNIVPFYAKMSFWGKKIIYFDMAITPTIGMTAYDQMIQGGNQTQRAFTYGIDITQYFFFTNYFAIRADLKNQWTSESVVAFKGIPAFGTETGKKVQDQNTLDTLFLIGLTFFY